MNEPHITEQTWEQLATNELAPARRAETLRHVMACSRCRAIHRGLRALEDAARAEDLLPARPSHVRMRWFAGVAVALAATAGLLVWWRAGQQEDHTLRGSAATTLAVTSPARIRAGNRVTWPAAPNAVAYDVEIFTPDGKPSASLLVDQPAVTWPASAPGSYRWRVTAIDRAGEEGAVSALLGVEVVP